MRTSKKSIYPIITSGDTLDARILLFGNKKEIIETATLQIVLNSLYFHSRLFSTLLISYVSPRGIFGDFPHNEIRLRKCDPTRCLYMCKNKDLSTKLGDITDEILLHFG